MLANEVKVYKGNIAVDDRGQLSFVNDFNFEGVKRFYIVKNHKPDFIRAWHAHKEEGKYVTVLSGAAIIGLVDLRGISRWDEIEKIGQILVSTKNVPDSVFETKAQIDSAQVYRYVLSDKIPTVIWIPPGFANGAKTLVDGTKIMYMSTRTIEESKGDDYRFSYSYWGEVWVVTYR